MPTIYDNDPTRVLNEAPAPPAPVQAHTEAEEEYLEDLHRRLKPEAQAAYINFYLARTPAHLQEDMKDLIESDLTPDAPPPEADSAARPAPPQPEVQVVEPAPVPVEPPTPAP